MTYVGKNDPINLDGSPRERAKAKVWQGAMALVAGGGASAVTWFFLGFVWWGTVVFGLAGLFWMITGLVTVLTDYE